MRQSTWRAVSKRPHLLPRTIQRDLLQLPALRHHVDMHFLSQPSSVIACDMPTVLKGEISMEEYIGHATRSSSLSGPRLVPARRVRRGWLLECQFYSVLAPGGCTCVCVRESCISGRSRCGGSCRSLCFVTSVCLAVRSWKSGWARLGRPRGT